MFGRLVKYLLCGSLAFPSLAGARTNLVAGPLFSEFSLTLGPGHRTEAAGPFYYSQQSESERQFGFPPLFNFAEDPEVELKEFNLLYPVVGYRRYGGEFRFQIVEMLSFAGGRTQEDEEKRRFSFFPFYIRQRAPDPSDNYTAVFPFYGRLKNRFFRDDIRFVMFPAYAVTRKKDVVTTNYCYPFVHRRGGENLEGWQVWPFVGREHKGVTYRTNALDEREVIGGHERSVLMWPFSFKAKEGLGTTNASELKAVIPFYSRFSSGQRDSVSYGWPFGYSVTEDREAKYVEKAFPWPLWVRAEGEGKTIRRYFPFFSQAKSKTKESTWYMWPVYKFNRLHSDPLDRTRTRIGLFLYSDTVEKNTETGASYRRIDCWPLFTFRRDLEGKERWQVLAIIEPYYPNSRTVPREYAPVYSFWRWEKDGRNGATSRSLLWNLYRREGEPGRKKLSLCFGLFQYESNWDSKSWQVCYFLGVKKPGAENAPQP